jgi:hypothetical protein
MTARRIQTVDSLYDFIGYIVLCAPDQFPNRDYLPSDQQRGLSATLDRSLASYRQGDIVAGAHTLQYFQDLIFKE